MDVLFHISEVPQSFANSSSGRSEVAKSNVLVKPPNCKHVKKSESHLRPQTGLLHDGSAAIAQNKYGNVRVSRYPPNTTFAERNKAWIKGLLTTIIPNTAFSQQFPRMEYCNARNAISTIRPTHHKSTFKIWRKDYILLTQQLKKAMKKVPNQTWTSWNWMPKQTLNSDFLESRNGFLLKATWRRSSTERNAACQHFFKTSAVELVENWQNSGKCTHCTRLLPSATLANSEFAALVAVGSGLPVQNGKSNISLMHDSPWRRVQELVKPWSKSTAQKG